MKYTEREKELLNIIRTLMIERAWIANAVVEIAAIIKVAATRVVERQDILGENEFDVISTLENKYGAIINEDAELMTLKFPFDKGENENEETSI